MSAKSTDTNGLRHETMRNVIATAALAALGLLLSASAASAAEEGQPPGEPASRSTFVHHVPLLDTEGNKITPSSDPTMPFSTRTTCGKCHDYKTVSGGWHSNAPDPNVAPGRPAQPWILVNRRTGTQLPVSYRPWPGTYRPADVGLTPWKFVLTFGRHLPGGGPGEMPDDDPQSRWLVSGKLEINCQTCHSGEPAHDQVQWLLAISEQNFMWAPLATTALGSVHGSARRVPDTYDAFMESNQQAASKGAPVVTYDAAKFDAAGRAYFNTVHKPAPARCYFCHTNHRVGPGAPEKWETDEDVHLAAGLACADCHRNGLDHQITRNYEGEAEARGKPDLAALTCRGCHLGDGPDGEATRGRLGAPVPQHVGLPTLHFEKLSCTACHSGPAPRDRAGRVQTSRAHAIEFHGEHRGDDAPPYIAEPVFVKQVNARDGHEEIAPHRMIWPAFWGRLKGDAVTPLSPDAVIDAADKILETKPAAEGEAAKDITLISREQILETLKALAADTGAEPVYVGGGKLYRLTGDGKLAGEDHPAARPYSWPLAHDVRPATQALGYDGECTDCHSMDAPFFFGEVAAEVPADLGEPETLAMHHFEKLDPTALTIWALTFEFRPVFKVMLFTVGGLMAAIVILYAFRALAAILRWAGARSARG